ncbi:hypothetical protein B1H19_02340 [Streptomyces gilvosporeus]|uniref:histidine kinase n=1 Tax=Streptomyces gilvosporeus TaxID=553510 RepID=A0A1V0TJX0_9ACTN|nr:hypothetical protein B1H19_02340 [Streptomyces gilvosporeus]
MLAPAPGSVRGMATATGRLRKLLWLLTSRSTVRGPEWQGAVWVGDDELTRLGQSLNHMLDRLEASTEREHQFLADASHELRTPLALRQGLRGEARASSAGPGSCIRVPLSAASCDSPLAATWRGAIWPRISQAVISARSSWRENTGERRPGYPAGSRLLLAAHSPQASASLFPCPYRARASFSAVRCWSDIGPRTQTGSSPPAMTQARTGYGHPFGQH